MERYFKILGVSPDATLTDIRSAYRLKAKLLHPDLNKSPNAHEEFISLNEAYEYLINLKTGKVYSQNRAHTKTYQSSVRWQDDFAARARHRAEYYGNMKYDKFAQSEYYKTITSLNVILDHFGFFIALAVLILLPVVMTVFYGWLGLGISLIAVLATFRITIDAFRVIPTMDWKELKAAVLTTGRSKVIRIALFILVNCFVFLKIVLQTLMTIKSIFAFYTLPVLITWIIAKIFLKKGNNQTSFLAFAIIPVLINIVFTVNFVFSTHPVTETYAFRNYIDRAHGKPIATSEIRLENDRYDEYFGIRIFSDYEETRMSNSITYTFKDGILGWRVMTAYKFN